MRPLVTSILASSFLIQSSFASGGIFEDFAFGTVWAGGWDRPDDYYDAAYTVRVTKTKYVCPCESTGLASTTTTSASYGGGPGGSTTKGTGSSSTSVASTTSSSASSSTSSSSSSSSVSTSGTGSTSSTTSTSGTGTTSLTSSTSLTSTLTTTTSTTTVVTRTQTTPYVPVQTDTFNFKAYGNPFVADGTSLGDIFVLRTDYPDRGYGIFNNGSTNFYIDNNGALVDQQTGGQACVFTGSNPAVIRFATPGYINDNTTADYGKLSVCVCQATTVAAVSCLCDGKTQFAVDYRSYLYIRSAIAITSSSTSTFSASYTSPTTDSSSATTTTDSSSTSATTTTDDATSTPAAKRDLERRQASSTSSSSTSSSSTTTSSSASNTATTPVAVTVSAASATTTVTPTTCQYPLQTMNIVSGGSTPNPGNTSYVYTYADGAYMKQLDWDKTNHWQWGGIVNGSFNDANNTANGFYGGNFTYDRCSGLIQETTYGRIICAGPGKRQFGALFIMPYDKIIADGGDLCICNISSTNVISCQCGPSYQFQTSNDGEYWLGNGSQPNYANNYPRAVFY